MSETKYIIVYDNETAKLVAGLLDQGYILVASWTSKYSVHHILKKVEDKEA